MADRTPAPDTPELRERWGNFAFDAEYEAKAQKALARYPEGRKKSAVMPLLALAQRQVGEETDTQGWLPLPVMPRPSTALRSVCAWGVCVCVCLSSITTLPSIPGNLIAIALCLTLAS